MQSTSTSNPSTPDPFKFTISDPYSKLNGQSATIPYLVSGLLTLGGLSVLGAKPKCGKSSLARYIAVQTTKGQPSLGRKTAQGDVLIFNLEDPAVHVANHLRALGHSPEQDGQIHIVENLSPVKGDNFDALRQALKQMPMVRLVIVDHLAKFLRVSDIGDYAKVQEDFRKLHDIAREFSHAHILCLVHCKKVQTDDPFDQILGSTALRGEPDTNIVIYKENSQRIITAETRVGKSIPATLLCAETVEVDDSTLVKDFTLGGDYERIKKEDSERKAKRRKASHADRVIEYLSGCDEHTATLKEIKSTVEGKAESIVEAIGELEEKGVLTITEGKGKGAPKIVKMDLTTVTGQLYSLAAGRIN